MSVAKSGRIDVHHHLVTKAYADILVKTGGDPSGWHIPEWTVEADTEFSKSQGIGAAILSLTAPGVEILPDIAAQKKLARQTNEEMAAIRDAHPQSYGFFATLPTLLDTDAAIEEIAYALEELKADGVTLFTRYGSDNHYLGHSNFKPIWDELDRRNAVVFIHPTHPVDTNPINNTLRLPQPMIEYPFETTKTAVDLIITDTVRTHQRCKIILSHAGGTLPWLASRPASMIPHVSRFGIKKSKVEFMEDAKSFYFDLALSSDPRVVEFMVGWAQEGHILYGSDFPYAPTGSIVEFVKGLESWQGTEDAKKAIDRGNAVKLFPRFK